MDIGKKKPAASSDHINTIIGAGTKFTGDINAEGGVRIDGNLQGNLTSNGRLSIGKDAIVKSDTIDVTAAIIGGNIEAKLNAPELVKLESTANFKGSISTKVLIIEQGAKFNGSSEMNNSSSSSSKQK